MKRLTSFVFVEFIVILALVLMMTGCQGHREQLKISLQEEQFILSVGESVPLRISPDIDCAIVTAENSDIVDVSGRTIIAKNRGKTHIKVQIGDNERSFKVEIYDAIADINATSEYRYRSITEAIEKVPNESIIYVKSGKYDEVLLLDKSITIVGEDGATLKSISICKDTRVTLENLLFYSRDYLGEGNASIMAMDKVSLTTHSCRFFIDKKESTAKDRKDGYAIYVYPNSSLVDIEDCDFSSYKECINIESTGGKILVDSNKFSSTNLAIKLDVRDYNTGFLANKNATGKISDNVYIDVEKEIDFIYSGSSYTGDIVIEKHDKL